MVLPEVSPYHLPTWGDGAVPRHPRTSTSISRSCATLARRPGAPALHIGAVEVLSGHFEVFTGEELRVECLLASAAIPELFRAVTVPGRGVYWDGLFSQNPPIHDLTDHQHQRALGHPDQPEHLRRVPTETHEILDRRNELAGNLSMEQELTLIEIINRLIAAGASSSTPSITRSTSRASPWIGTWSTARSSIAGRGSWRSCGSMAGPRGAGS